MFDSYSVSFIFFLQPRSDGGLDVICSHTVTLTGSQYTSTIHYIGECSLLKYSLQRYIFCTLFVKCYSCLLYILFRVTLHVGDGSALCEHFGVQYLARGYLGRVLKVPPLLPGQPSCCVYIRASNMNPSLLSLVSYRLTYRCHYYYY